MNGKDGGHVGEERRVSSITRLKCGSPARSADRPRVACLAGAPTARHLRRSTLR